VQIDLQARGRSEREFEIEPRRSIEDLERSWDLETFYDLTTLLAGAFANNLLVNEDLPDSRARMDVILDWSNEFNQVHAWDDWTRLEYLQTVEDWFKLKISQLLAARHSAKLGPTNRSEKSRTQLKGS